MTPEEIEAAMNRDENTLRKYEQLDPLVALQSRDAAIAYVVETLARMHEAINRDRPITMEGEAPHMTMVRWMPIVSDYQMIVLRQRHDNAQDRSWLANREARIAADQADLIDHTVKVRRQKAALSNMRSSMREILAVLDASENEDKNTP